MFAQSTIVFLLLAVCVDGVPRETLDRSLAAANSAASRFQSQTRKLQSLMMKALGPTMRKAVTQTPGRRLDATQCAWTGSACEAGADFISSLIPASGEISQLWESQQACMAHESETACENAGCTWDDGITCSVSMGQDSMMSTMTSLLSGDDCGWISSVMQPSPCLSYAANGGQCSAANGCTVNTEYEPQTGGTCAEVTTCVAGGAQEDLMASLCPSDFNLTQSLSDCFLPMLLSFGANPTAESLASMQSQAMTCALQACPAMLGLVNAQMELGATCQALTDQVACTQSSQCQWEGDGCNINVMAAMMQSIPAGCPFKNILDTQSGCQGLAQGQCTGTCEWQVSEACSGATIVQTSECGPKLAEIMRAMARAGSSEAAGLVNGMLVEEHCGSLEVQDLCETSAMVLETFATNDRMTSSSPGLRGGMAVLVAVALGNALRTGAQSRHT